MTFGTDVILPPPFVGSMLLLGSIGALSAILAHRSVSVFHDGLRPVMRDYRLGNLEHRDVGRTSFRLGWGFFWAFGIPFSLGAVIPLVYMIFMATDWIGVSTRGRLDVRWYRSGRALGGVLVAGSFGALWGVAVAVVLRGLAELMQRLPIDMFDVTALFAVPAADAYFLLVLLPIAYHFGYRKAAIVLVLASVVWAVAGELAWPVPSAFGFAVIALAMVVFLVMEVRAATSVTVSRGDEPDWAVLDDDEEEDDDEFAANVKRIRSAAVPLIALSMLMGAAYNGGVMAKDPVSGVLYSQGLAVPAALVMAVWAFSYIPMKFTTATMTGCMATGTFLEVVVALLMPNPWAAAIACGVLRLVELLALRSVVTLVERVPQIRTLADVVRTAIFQVMEIGCLIGGALAASHLAGGWGVGVVIGAWFLNARKSNPVMPMSVGVVAALGVGLFVNALALVGLALP
ncbi:YhfT family protein [Nocardioides sp.]|uniref:YhfT family protein n=1 Tax=Nocardioides sp. TaxID=35761 RepID=UPI00262BB457|nr:YhfT family protein [Nocardioides sp.]MCW2736846.1 hypothetical protein [Nocardioides sp.]